ncbi:MAG: hypothetical protein ACI8S6_004013 [Myxococcota bacterium]
MSASQLVAFSRALLRGQQPTTPRARLPLRQPDAITAEAVAAIEDMAVKSVTRWLFRELGWRARDIIDPDDEDEVVSARAWDPAAWGALRLRFTAESIDLLLGLWNLHASDAAQPTASTLPRRIRRAMRKRPDEHEALLAKQRTRWQATDLAGLSTRPLAGSGDLFLDHLITRAYTTHDPTRSLAQWSSNPLSQLSWPDLFTPTPQRLGRLLEPDVLPLMPWIAAGWPAIWRARPPQRRSPDKAQAALLAQAMVWGAWCEQAIAAERADLLVPLCEGYADQLRSFEVDYRKLDETMAARRWVDRQPVWDAWAEALGPLQRIERAWRAAHSRHPIDRSGSDRLLLAGAAAADLSHWSALGARAAATLRGDIA